MEIARKIFIAFLMLLFTGTAFAGVYMLYLIARG